MSVIEGLFLIVKFGVQIGVLLFPVDQEVLLIVNLLSKGCYHVDVCLHSALIVILHSPLLISNAVEVLLQVQQLVLQVLVFSLPLSQIHSFLPQLGHKAVFVVLVSGSIVQFSVGARHFRILSFLIK